MYVGVFGFVLSPCSHASFPWSVLLDHHPCRSEALPPQGFKGATVLPPQVAWNSERCGIPWSLASSKLTYPLVMTNIAIENGPFVLKHGGFPWLCHVSLPEGIFFDGKWHDVFPHLPGEGC